ANRINSIGGHCNAFTAEDVTVYMNSVPRNYLDMVLDLESDRMRNLTLDESLFQTERRVIIEEYHTYMNNPVGKAFLEFRQEFFKGHPYNTSPLGKLQDLQDLTVEKCRNYYDQWYAPENVVLVIVGDFDETTILSRVADRFGNLSSKAKSSVSPVVTTNEIPHSSRKKQKVDFDVPVLIVGYPAPPSSHEDAVALEILQMVISGGESSRLYREVVRKQSLAVMASGMNQLLKYSGISMFFAIFTPDVRAANVEAAIVEQMKKIQAEGITDAEMEKVKNSSLTGRTFELYTIDNICHRIGHSECIEGDYRLWVERLEALKKLDRDHLIDVARKYWDDSKCHVLHLQPRAINPLLFAGGILRRLFSKRG
ncbi:MAG: insulinase family protein, partial [Fibrobacter sp.]|nr:insulinase family protein [Fibrobacter sp.]